MKRCIYIFCDAFQLLLQEWKTYTTLEKGRDAWKGSRKKDITRKKMNLRYRYHTLARGDLGNPWRWARRLDRDGTGSLAQYLHATESCNCVFSALLFPHVAEWPRFNCAFRRQCTVFDSVNFKRVRLWESSHSCISRKAWNTKRNSWMSAPPSCKPVRLLSPELSVSRLLVVCAGLVAVL